MLRLRLASSLVASVLLFGACTGSSPAKTATETTIADAPAPDTPAPDTLVVETALAEGEVPPLVDRPITNEPGTSTLATLSEREICSLVNDDETQKIWGFTTAFTLKSWTQTADDTSCAHIFGDEPTQGSTANVVWEVRRTRKADWPTNDAESKRSVSDIMVAKRSARTVITEASEFSSKDVDLFVDIDESVSLVVSLYGDDTVMDPSKLVLLAERILGRLSSLTLAPEPARNASVANVFDLTAGQYCGLLRDQTAEALLTDSFGSGTNGYLLTQESMSCSIGSAKLGIEVTANEPFVVDEATQTTLQVGTLSATWDKPSLEGTKAATGADLQYMSLRVKWRDVWVTVQARLVKNTPEVEQLVLDELNHVRAQLDAIVKP